MRGLDAEHGVLQEHDGVAHIDIIDAVCGLCKAELAQGTLQLRLVFPTAAERIGVPLLKTSGKQLVEEHPQRVLPLGLRRVNEQDLAGGVLAHIAARVQRAERVIQIVQQNRMSRRPAEQTRRSCQQKRRAGRFLPRIQARTACGSVCSSCVTFRK